MDSPPEPLDTAPPGRAGIVAIVGRANTGKSSLINAMVGEKVSIVTPVAQTTRNVIRAILTEPRGQLVFLDTPGVHKSVSALGSVMNRAARATAAGADTVLLVVDISEPPRMEDEGWIARLVRAEQPVVVAANKTDRPANRLEAYQALWAAKKAETGGTRDADWLPTSATTGTGVAELVTHLFSLVPAGPPLFPDNILTDYPRRLAIGDVVREKLLGVLREELPHEVTVWVEDLTEEPDGWTAEAIVYVNKPSQKGIVIGEKGRVLRKVRRQAEAELENMYGHRVTVKLWVKIEKGWIKNFWLLKKFGFT